jgi:4-alpha-glucanotransferase
MKRSSGVLMHVSSLWDEYSVGSFGEPARKWIDFLKDCGFGVWQVLPFCLPDECNSPYKSYSAFSGNPNFIDLVALYQDGLLTKEELDSAKQRTPYLCEFDRLREERMPLLAKAAARFTDTAAIDAFLNEYPHTANFCRFMALKKANNDLPWYEWTVTEPDFETQKVWDFAQYIFFTQWASLKKYAEEQGISIIGDIPIYVALDSSDVWACPEQFQLDEQRRPSCVAGVPPDYFAEEGQLWGNPLYDWEKMEKDGFAWWKDRMTFMTKLFDGVRIDHFRGLESYYSIPATHTNAKNGKWVKGPGMALINALREVCGDKLLIAEDLGDITPEVENLVKDSGCPGMKVLQFAFLGDENSPHLPHNYPENCIAYTGTHDNNTLLGYVWELDNPTRKKLMTYCGYPGEQWNRSYDTILRTLFQSHAGMVIIPVQDLLLYGADTRMNTPGSVDGNWRFRITKEQLMTADTEKFKLWNQLYQRNR